MNSTGELAKSLPNALGSPESSWEQGGNTGEGLVKISEERVWVGCAAFLHTLLSPTNTSPQFQPTGLLSMPGCPAILTRCQSANNST